MRLLLVYRYSNVFIDVSIYKYMSPVVSRGLPWPLAELLSFLFVFCFLQKCPLGPSVAVIHQLCLLTRIIGDSVCVAGPKFVTGLCCLLLPPVASRCLFYSIILKPLKAKSVTGICYLPLPPVTCRCLPLHPVVSRCLPWSPPRLP